MEHPSGCACETCYPHILRRSELRTAVAGLVHTLPQDALEEALAYLRDLADREDVLEATST